MEVRIGCGLPMASGYDRQQPEIADSNKSL